jgi:hypothetical protein
MPETISNFHGIEETLKDPPAGATLYASKKNARITALVELADALTQTSCDAVPIKRRFSGRQRID